ncbi:hypothetical protein [Corallococcus exercitus]|uniref:hypothetical protein n=1 Tax=Corallococcus exercitus TaxID=2316736 RepID=UPI0035D413F0
MKKLIQVMAATLLLVVATAPSNDAMAESYGFSEEFLEEVRKDTALREYRDALRAARERRTPEEQDAILQQDLQRTEFYKIADDAKDPSTMTELERWLSERDHSSIVAKYGPSGKATILSRFEEASRHVEARDTAIQVGAVAVGVIVGVVLLLAFFSMVWRRARPLALAVGEQVVKKAKERERAKAQDELLTYKRLFDEGILNQDEYAKKAEELKKQIL